jgi:hypothetical protein
VADFNPTYLSSFIETQFQENLDLQYLKVAWNFHKETLNDKPYVHPSETWDIHSIEIWESNSNKISVMSCIFNSCACTSIQKMFPENFSHAEQEFFMTRFTHFDNEDESHHGDEGICRMFVISSAIIKRFLEHIQKTHQFIAADMLVLEHIIEKI